MSNDLKLALQAIARIVISMLIIWFTVAFIDPASSNPALWPTEHRALWLFFGVFGAIVGSFLWEELAQ